MGNPVAFPKWISRPAQHTTSLESLVRIVKICKNDRQHKSSSSSSSSPAASAASHPALAALWSLTRTRGQPQCLDATSIHITHISLPISAVGTIAVGTHQRWISIIIIAFLLCRIWIYPMPYFLTGCKRAEANLHQQQQCSVYRIYINLISKSYCGMFGK